MSLEVGEEEGKMKFNRGFPLEVPRHIFGVRKRMVFRTRRPRNKRIKSEIGSIRLGKGSFRLDSG